MTYNFPLEPQWDHCPIEWKNFINFLKEQIDLPEGNGVPIEVINRALSKYNGHYTPPEHFNDPSIDFASDSDLLVFKLTYSN